MITNNRTVVTQLAQLLTQPEVTQSFVTPTPVTQSSEYKPDNWDLYSIWYPDSELVKAYGGLLVIRVPSIYGYECVIQFDPTEIQE